MAENRHRLFRAGWWSTNLLLATALGSLLYSGWWEYSVRQYLRGFSDAIVPAAAAPEEQVRAILAWMSSGPPRQVAANPAMLSIARSGDNPQLSATAIGLRFGHQRVPEFVAERRVEYPAAALAYAGAEDQTRGGGSADRRALGDRRSVFSRHAARCRRQTTDSQGAAESGDLCAGDWCSAELSEGIRLCALRAHSHRAAAIGWIPSVN